MTDEKIEKLAKQLKNQSMKKWRAKNKEKVKEANKKYWLKKAKEYLATEMEE